MYLRFICVCILFYGDFTYDSFVSVYCSMAILLTIHLCLYTVLWRFYLRFICVCILLYGNFTYDSFVSVYCSMAILLMIHLCLYTALWRFYLRFICVCILLYGDFTHDSFVSVYCSMAILLTIHLCLYTALWRFSVWQQHPSTLAPAVYICLENPGVPVDLKFLKYFIVNGMTEYCVWLHKTFGQNTRHLVKTFQGNKFCLFNTVKTEIFNIRKHFQNWLTIFFVVFKVKSQKFIFFQSLLKFVLSQLCHASKAKCHKGITLSVVCLSVLLTYFAFEGSTWSLWRTS